MLKKVIAMYIRLSLEDGDVDFGNKTESNSIGNQRMLISDYLHSRDEFANYEILEFCDDGYTGTNFNRPGFQHMMELVKLKKVDCIIVKDLSRFGREYLDVSSYLELILPVFGTRFISINDFFDSNDYIGTTGGMELAFRNLINAMYSKDISMKVKSARNTRARKGEYIGGHPFYGYIKDPADCHHLIVDEPVRPVIEKIFQLCIDGVSTMTIAKILNEENVPSPSEYKKAKGIKFNKPLTEGKALWLQCTVRKILKDERYTGKMISNINSSIGVGRNTVVANDPSDWIVVENTHEAIISNEMFLEARAALKTRVRNVNQNTSWKNSGNLFVCGHCGRKLQKSRSKQIYLYCMKAQYSNSAECTAVHVDMESLQNVVLDTIKAMGRAMTNGSMVAKKKSQTDLGAIENEIQILQQRQAKIKSEKSQMYENYRLGIITREQFIEIQSERAKETEEIEEMISNKNVLLEQKRKEQLAMQIAQDELKTVETITEYDPAIIGQIVEKVLVYEGGRIELVMKNKDSYDFLMEKDEMSA